jgi:dihydroorotase
VEGKVAKSKSHKYVIKNGRVIDPLQGIDKKADILIEGGTIKGIGSYGDKDGEIVEVNGLIVCPGFIDMHTHLREPGREDQETIETGTMAAARGGFTGVATMPNTNPVIDNSGMISFVKETAERDGYVDVFPIGAVTKGQQGEELAEMNDMVNAGSVGFSDDGYTVASAYIMRKALEYAQLVDKVIIVHEEDPDLCAGGQMNEDLYATKFGLPGMPAIGESIMVGRDVAIQEFVGGKLHIAHVSVKESLTIIKEAKKRGLCITAEVTPHHFSLDSSCLSTYDANLKMKPPLRGKEDIKALKKGLKDGTIDVIATDHAPHAIFEKESEFGSAPFGIIGLETAIGVCCTELIHPGVLTLSQLVEKMSANPARILGIGERNLKEGADASLTIFDPEREWTVEVDEFASKSSNSPYDGRKLKGYPVMTMVRGEIVYREGEFFR